MLVTHFLEKTWNAVSTMEDVLTLIASFFGLTLNELEYTVIAYML